MTIELRSQAQEDILYFRKRNKVLLARIKSLIQAIEREPFYGIGRPEPLKYELSNCWSRRIDHEHRLVYKIEKNKIIILQCRYHY
jgi:toxin YoeB